ncbi:MAG: hypothetical protein ACFFCO_02595 [Promethearchaeota archaeon]
MFETAFSLAQKQQCSPHLASGVTPLDELLGGGFEAGLSYLLYGSPYATQLLLRCAANALRQVAPDRGVVIIDGDQDASPSAVLDELKATAFPGNPAALLEYLHVARAFTTDQLLSLLTEAPSILQQTRAPILFCANITKLLQQEEESAFPQAHIPRGELRSSSPFRRAQLASQLKRLALSQAISVVASAETDKSCDLALPRIGGVGRHAFQVHVGISQRGPVDIFTLEKHPSLPWQQRGTIASYDC